MRFDYQGATGIGTPQLLSVLSSKAAASVLAMSAHKHCKSRRRITCALGHFCRLGEPSALAAGFGGIVIHDESTFQCDSTIKGQPALERRNR